jgi:hypothetical protein
MYSLSSVELRSHNRSRRSLSVAPLADVGSDAGSSGRTTALRTLCPIIARLCSLGSGAVSLVTTKSPLWSNCSTNCWESAPVSWRSRVCLSLSCDWTPVHRRGFFSPPALASPSPSRLPESSFSISGWSRPIVILVPILKGKRFSKIRKRDYSGSFFTKSSPGILPPYLHRAGPRLRNHLPGTRDGSSQKAKQKRMISINSFFSLVFKRRATAERAPSSAHRRNAKSAPSNAA